MVDLFLTSCKFFVLLRRSLNSHRARMPPNPNKPPKHLEVAHLVIAHYNEKIYPKQGKPRYNGLWKDIPQQVRNKMYRRWRIHNDSELRNHQLNTNRKSKARVRARNLGIELPPEPPKPVKWSEIGPDIIAFYNQNIFPTQGLPQFSGTWEEIEPGRRKTMRYVFFSHIDEDFHRWWSDSKKKNKEDLRARLGDEAFKELITTKTRLRSQGLHEDYHNLSLDQCRSFVQRYRDRSVGFEIDPAYNQWLKYMHLRLTVARYSMKRKAWKCGSIEPNLSDEEYVDRLNNPCVYCGSLPCDEPTMSIDRVDSERGYVADNCVSACMPCNTAKLDRALSDFLAYFEQTWTSCSQDGPLVARPDHPFYLLRERYRLSDEGYMKKLQGVVTRFRSGLLKEDLRARGIAEQVLSTLP